MSTPDIRVRLTPEGLNEVIFALRQLQKESAKGNRQASQQVGLISQALRELKTLVPVVGLGATVTTMAALGKQSLVTADQVGKLAQKVGGTVTDISALTLAFRQNEGSQDSLQLALTKTANLVDQLRRGNKEQQAEAGDLLKSIGVDPATISDDTPRALEAIAKGLANIPPSALKAAAAQKIFSKNSADLMIALDAVGREGIDGFKRRAQELGLLITDEFAAAAAKSIDQMQNVKLAAEGLATQFTSGFANPVGDAMREFSEAITAASAEGGGALNFLGEQAGLVIRGIVGLFVAAGKTIGGLGNIIVTSIQASAEALDALVRGNLSGAREALARRGREIAETFRNINDDISKAFRVETPALPQNRPKQTGTVGDFDTKDQAAAAKAAAAARLAATKQALQDELNLQQEKIKREESALKIGYEQNLISLRTFFDQRRKLIEQQQAAEIRALQLERANVIQENTGANAPGTDAEKVKFRQQLDALNARIKAREVQGARELSELDAERAAALRGIADEQRGLANTLDELEGNRHAVFERNLAEEAKQIRELGLRAGDSAESIDRQVARLTQARTAAFDFEEAQRRGQSAFESFNRDAEQIRRDQQSGVITQFEGERRLIELERERLQNLRAMSQELLKAAQATKNVDQIRAAQEYADSVKEIEASYRAATDVVQQFKVGVAEGFETGLRNILRNREEIHNLEDAFRSLGDTVLSVLNDISAAIISEQLTKGLEGLLGIGGPSSQPGGGGGGGGFIASVASFFSKLFGRGARAGGKVENYSDGGRIIGPGTGTSDSIPGIITGGSRPRLLRVSNDEFIVRSKAARQPGAYAFLREFNALRAPVPIRRASGGTVGAVPASALLARPRSDMAGAPTFHISQIIQAPTQEIGRRTANQSATEIGTLVSSASRRYK